MMAKITAVALLAIFVTGSTISAQQIASVPPDLARYEIVQSNRTIKDTFRLDRWSGAVEVLLGKEDNDLAWRRIQFRDPPTFAPTAPRFQMSISIVAAKGTYLLDTLTGASWVLLGNEPHELIWQPIK